MVATEQERPIRIVILLGAPLTEQNFERVGIPYLSKHFDVMVFECTELLGRNHEIERVHWHNFFAIKSVVDLSVQIEKYRPHYAIDLIGFGVLTLPICQVLAKNNVKFVIPKIGSNPLPKIEDRVKKLMRLISTSWKKGILVDSKNNTVTARKTPILGRIFKPLNRTHKKVKEKLQKVRILREIDSLPNHIGLIAGFKSLDSLTSKSDPIIWVGANDYHAFNKAKNELGLNRNRWINKDFILFIDDCLLKATDWMLLGISPPVTEELYYPALTTFFAKIEAIYDMPVKIAGHPNSLTDRNFQFNMGGRSIIFGDTAALALQSSLVLVHGSTAISFAVLARKPIVSLTSQELDQENYGQHVRTVSSELGSPLVFIDLPVKQINNLEKLKVDEKKYSLYEANYLYNDLCTEGEPWGAFIDYINSSS
jgi:hypothetical protein